MVVRSWEESEGEGKCKNQIHCCCHHQDKGGLHEGHGINNRCGGDKAFGKGGGGGGICKKLAIRCNKCWPRTVSQAVHAWGNGLVA